MAVPNVFTPSVNDQSLKYLYDMFGSMYGVIKPPGAAVPTYDTTLLSSMFATFNTILLAVGALIVVYVTVVGVMMTAHEGEFMGKKWNNPWIVIRMVLGITALVPTPSGYSGIQVIMMWVIVQGVGAADMVWARALDYVNFTGSVFGKVSVTTTESRQALKNLFIGILCYKTAAADYPNTYPSEGNVNAYYCNKHADSAFCKAAKEPAAFAPSLDGTNYQMGPSLACGVLNYCNVAQSCEVIPGNASSGPTSLKCLSCQASITALREIIPFFATTADIYVKMDYDYQDYWAKSAKEDSSAVVPEFAQTYCDNNSRSPCNWEALPSPFAKDNPEQPLPEVIEEIYWPLKLKDISGDFLSVAISKYSLALQGVVDDYLAAQASTNTALAQPLNDAKATGWILAGSFYSMLSRMNGKNVNDSLPSLKVSFSSERSPTSPSSALYEYRSNYKAAARLLGVVSGVTSSGTDPAMADVTEPAGSATSDTSETFTTMVTQENANPLGQLAVAGYTMLLIAQIFYLVMMIVAILLGVASMSFYVFGTGVTNPTGYISNFLFYFLVPLIMMFLGFLVSVGASFCIYIPFIPYIIFTMGAIGWLFSTIEAMVAGPLVALGILSPSGHHELLGKAEPALLLLFAIFLRPTLMIFGFFAAMLLSSVVVTMINTGFATVFVNLFDFAGVGHGAGVVAAAFNPLTLVFILMVYVTLLTSAMNKCFAAIHLVPERVMRWIGGQGDQYGEGEAVGEVKGAVGSAAKSSSDLMGSGSKSAMDKANSQRESGSRDAQSKADNKKIQADRDAAKEEKKNNP